MLIIILVFDVEIRGRSLGIAFDGQALLLNLHTDLVDVVAASSYYSRVVSTRVL